MSKLLVEQIISYFPSTHCTEFEFLAIWCEKNGWSDLKINGKFQYYATSPNNFSRVPLPQEALVKLAKYRQIFYILDLVKPLQSINKNLIRSIKLGTVYWVWMLCIVNLLSSVFATAQFIGIFYKLGNMSLFLAGAILLAYIVVFIWSYLEYIALNARLSKPHYVVLLGNLIKEIS